MSQNKPAEKRVNIYVNTPEHKNMEFEMKPKTLCFTQLLK